MNETIDKRAAVLGWLTAAMLLGLAWVSAHAEEEMFADICIWEQSFAERYKNAMGESRRKQKIDFAAGSGIKAQTFATADGGTIHGVVWEAKRSRSDGGLSGQAKGYLLIAPGNAMMVAGIYQHFETFRDIGLDVYLYDYRGYRFGSPLKTTLAGILSDYSRLIKHLNQVYENKEHYVYGISFGGLVLLNALDAIKTSDGESDSGISGIALDSVPHKVSFFESLFCPARINPINFLPASCKDWLVVAGPQDWVVDNRAVELAEAARECGATAEIINGAGHIFSGDSEKTLRDRLSKTKNHFKSLMDSGE